jgi:hypothetical protein
MKFVKFYQNILRAQTSLKVAVTKKRAREQAILKIFE